MFEISLEALAAGGVGTSIRSETREQRLRKLERRRRERRLTVWWWSKGRRGALPDWGYRCDGCDYPLVGLREPRCPECGATFLPARAAQLMARGISLDLVTVFHVNPYAPRPIRPSGLLNHEGWRLKQYDITIPGDVIDEEVYEAGRALALGALPSPAAAARRLGVGFLIRHQGLDGLGYRASYLVLCWWDNGNELMTEVFLHTAEGGWRDARGRGSFCVWDLQVMAHERDAYVRAVLGPDGPDGAAYLADARAQSP